MLSKSHRSSEAALHSVPTGETQQKSTGVWWNVPQCHCGVKDALLAPPHVVPSTDPSDM